MTYALNRPDDDSAMRTAENGPGHGVEQSEQTKTDQPKSSETGIAEAWLPFFLRPNTLFAFSACYFAIAVFLIFLALHSHKHEGFATTDPGLYFLWRYAPTAIVAAFWNQVDYRSRLMMPWILMSKQPQCATKSVLLDYISPNILLAWARSLKANDFDLTVSLSGTLLNKILVVLSTGLFTTTNNNRVQLRGAALWVTISILLLLASASLHLAFKMNNQRVVSRDTGSVTGLATILARSEAFVHSLQGYGLCSFGHIENHFSKNVFRTRLVAFKKGVGTSPKFFIQPQESSCQKQDIDEILQNGAESWYRPFIVSIMARSIIVVLGVGLCGILEATCQYADRNNGLIVFKDVDYIDYTWKYIPAITFILFGLAIAALDFEVKTFEPFYRLRNGKASSCSTIDTDYLGFVSLHSFCVAFRRKQYCIAATSLAVLFTPFLTIFAAGLFSPYDAYKTSTNLINLHQMDRIVTEGLVPPVNYTEKVGEGTCAIEAVINDSMRYLLWNCTTVAIPKLLLALPEEDKNPARTVPHPQARLIIPVPCFQATANCTQIPPVNTNSTYVRADYYTAAHIKVKLSLPKVGDTTTHSVRVNVPLDEGPFATYISHHVGYEANNIVVAGYLYPNKTTDLNVLLCEPYLDRIYAAATLIYTELRMGYTTFPEPKFDESTRAFAGPLNMSVDIPKPDLERIQYDEPNSKFNESDFRVEDFEMVDGFFGTIVYSGINLSTLVRDPSLLRSSVEDLYRRIAAQVLSTHRETITNRTNAPVITGTLYTYDQIRLYQNYIPTRVLEALLAVIVACTATTFLLTNTKKVLPKNPRSIAAVASLLAGSNLLSEEIIPPGSEWCSDAELRKRGLFDGLLLRMGWWEDVDVAGETRFGIDYVRERQEGENGE